MRNDNKEILARFRGIPATNEKIEGQSVNVNADGTYYSQIQNGLDGDLVLDLPLGVIHALGLCEGDECELQWRVADGIVTLSKPKTVNA